MEWLSSFLLAVEPLLDPISGTPIPEPNFMGDFIRMLTILGGMVALLFGVTWVLRRMTTVRNEQLNETSPIRIVERRSLSPKSAIYLVEIEDKVIVLGETPNGLVRLSDWTQTQEPEK